MLKMKKVCQRCSSELGEQAEAYICSYECTFCPDCTDAMNAICPNCDGNLVIRPMRTRKVLDVASAQIKAKLFGGK